MESDYFDAHILHLRQELKVKRDTLVASLKETLPDQAEFIIPGGGIHLWCKLNIAIDDHTLLEAAMKRGVVFVPGRVLGSKQGYVRFTFGRANTSSIPQGIIRLAEALKSHLK